MAEKAKYVLGSSEMVYAPGMVAWAINGAHFPKDRGKLISLVAATWGVPGSVARKLVMKAVPYKVEGEAVVFEV